MESPAHMESKVKANIFCGRMWSTERRGEVIEQSDRGILVHTHTRDWEIIKK